MNLTQSSAPAAEPVTLAEAKLHLKVDAADDNDLITAMIAAARIMAEAYTQRQLITATYTLKMDDFPGGYGIIQLPRTPIGTVTSITYIDTAGDSQTLAATVYEAITSDVSAYIVLKPGQVWPGVQSEKFNAVTVTFTAGYGAASTAVPDAVRVGMLLLIADMYEHREARADKQLYDNQTAKALLSTIKVRCPVA